MARDRLTTTMFICAAVMLAPAGSAQDGPELLFIRGADRSGGFLEAGSDAQRTEHLGDITNTSTAGGNHGWFELAETLRGAGYSLTQITETAENASGPSDGLPVAFDAMDLSVYDAVVFGSNNAAYTAAQVDAVEAYIRGGGGALFISDANFGGDWADASDSDQQFLDRFGLIMHQDQGTYSIQRSAGEFIVPDHPIFAGVDRFDGEGVTPIRVGTPTAGVNTTILANAEGNTRLNEPPFGNNMQGPSRSSGPDDAALLIATADRGKIVGHFDRNTFFNLNGAGTNINRFDNRQYALNLFRYLTAPPADLSGDGDVDDEDLGLFFSAFTGPDNTQGPLTNPVADLSGDSDVDDEDLGLAFSAFTGPLSPTNVPEPASLALLGLLALGLPKRGDPLRKSERRR